MPELRPDRADVDDPAAAAGLDHRPNRGLGRHQGAPQVDLHDPIPGVAGILLGIEQDLARAAADGVDDDVQPSEPLHDGGHDPFGLRLTGDVRRQRDALGTGSADPVGSGIDMGLIDVRDGDPGAGAAQRDGQGRSDRPAAAGDEGHAAVESEGINRAHVDSFRGGRAAGESRLI